tara:strand:- start:7935 stop:8243 length:309 start_codon:yes stop_codon:yes gene_type:complete
MIAQSIDISNSSGTGLVGYVITSYDDLVKVFGKPVITNEKTNVVWTVRFDDDKKTVATIYDWKERSIPMGKYAWHIGGHSAEAVRLVQEMLDTTLESNHESV